MLLETWYDGLAATQGSAERRAYWSDLLAIRAADGQLVPAASYWLAPFVGMLAWPWVFLLLDDARARLRVRDA